MVAGTVGCHTNNPHGSRQCWLSYNLFKLHFSLLKVILQKDKYNIEYLQNKTKTLKTICKCV